MYTENYLIIGGATKSGTTSLYKYLADHPDVCSANTKETRFFLESSYPLDSKYRLDRDGIDKYNWYFSVNTCHKLYLEATPDYLCSAIAADSIKQYLPNVKMIFILRDPVSRFCSWYNFAIATGRLAKNVSLADFFAYQRQNPVTKTTNQYYRALEQGLYSSYLKTYIDSLGHERVFVTTYDELASQPLELMRRICNFNNIDASHYDNYRFEIHNKTFKVKFQILERLYLKTWLHVANYTTHIKLLRKPLHISKGLITFVLNRFNRSEKVEEQDLQNDTLIELKNYYREDVIKLEKLLGLSTGWISVKDHRKP